MRGTARGAVRGAADAVAADHRPRAQRPRDPRATRGATAVGDLLPSVTVPPYAYAGFLTARDAIGDLPPVDAGGSNNAYTGRPERPYQQAARPCATDSRRVAAQPQADEVRKAVSPMGGSREKARG